MTILASRFALANASPSRLRSLLAPERSELLRQFFQARSSRRASTDLYSE
jgi:hypothetical protein